MSYTSDDLVQDICNIVATRKQSTFRALIDNFKKDESLVPDFTEESSLSNQLLKIAVLWAATTFAEARGLIISVDQAIEPLMQAKEILHNLKNGDKK
ncbi:hypothetical protein [Nitrospira sp. BLG_2]|uniref:hypothetical protein n=1 Tax=Nitrospira sp. BLG_2 TaxID=3397507 RepID=UPI003B9CD5D9